MVIRGLYENFGVKIFEVCYLKLILNYFKVCLSEIDFTLQKIYFLRPEIYIQREMRLFFGSEEVFYSLTILRDKTKSFL